jgi:hypothetical protein
VVCVQGTRLPSDALRDAWPRSSADLAEACLKNPLTRGFLYGPGGSPWPMSARCSSPRTSMHER